MAMDYVKAVKRILGIALQLGDKTQSFDEKTRLLGGIPEFDSMAVVNVITTIEEELGVAVEYDEISADTFETVGSLARFLAEKHGG